jgi:serine phosphatase RsbU (regulator of sigma subunit)
MKPVILCVDDEGVVLNSLKEQLKRIFGRDYTIEVAGDGKEALELVMSWVNSGVVFPLIISDHIMPEIKGTDLLIEIHQYFPKTMKILLTGQATADAVGEALNKANLYRYIAKPWDPEDLKLTIQSAIVTYFQEKQLDEQNHTLRELNEKLEEKVIERTKALEVAYKELEKKNDDITSSINYAKRIQSAILPLPEKMDSLLDDYFIYFKPRDIVSGDFYWIEKIERGFTTASDGSKVRGDKIILAVADCTGHGVPGAFMSLIGHSTLNETLANMRGRCDVETILNELHLSIRKILKQKETGTNDGMDIALCVIDKELDYIEYSGAKNPLYFVQNGEFFEIKADKNPIGGHQFEEKRSFTKHTVMLSPSSPTMFYIFSDGYQDQFGGKARKKFMVGQFKKLLHQISSLPCKEQKNTLSQIFINWMEEGGEHQIDDVLVLGVRL